MSSGDGFCAAASALLAMGRFFIGLSLLVLPQSANYQMIEIEADVTVTQCWTNMEGLRSVGLPASGGTNASYKIHCFVGTNRWIIEDTHIQNAVHTHYFTGSNVLTCVFITKEPWLQDLQDARHYVFQALQIPHKTPTGNAPHYGRYKRVTDSPDGRPSKDDASVLTWLAFCSGQFLRTPGRRMPPIIPILFDTEQLSERISVFGDPLGLPRKLELFSKAGDMRFCYEVLQSTNYNGWQLPTRFRMTRGSHREGGKSGDFVELAGNVKTIQTGKAFEIPKEVLSARPW